MNRLYYLLNTKTCSYDFYDCDIDETNLMFDGITPTEEIVLHVSNWDPYAKNINSNFVNLIISKVLQATCRKKLHFHIYDNIKEFEESEKNQIYALMSSQFESIKMDFDDVRLSTLKLFSARIFKVNYLAACTMDLNEEKYRQILSYILEGNTGIKRMQFCYLTPLLYENLTEWFCEYLEENIHKTAIPIIEFDQHFEATPNLKYIKWLENAEQEAESQKMTVKDVPLDSVITQIFANKSIRKLEIINCF